MPVDRPLGVPIEWAIMTKDEAINYYGSQVALASALHIAQASVSGWKSVPHIRQLQLERLTGGKLKADPGILKVRPKVKAAA